MRSHAVWDRWILGCSKWNRSVLPAGISSCHVWTGNRLPDWTPPSAPAIFSIQSFRSYSHLWKIVTFINLSEENAILLWHACSRMHVFVVQLDCTSCLALLHAELLMMSIPLQIQHRSLFPNRCINVDFPGAVWILSFWGNAIYLIYRLSYLARNLIFHNFPKFT